jgi:hypothetical protein
MLLMAALAAGCSRSHYRNWADAETYPVIAERVVSPAYDIGRTRVEPPPGSRLADPFDPDRPPKPPDDPAAALFMAYPGGMKGSKHWGRDGHTDLIEPPGWEEALGLDTGGPLKLTPEKAVEIALLNSREYQTALENVYLQALALTLNRFEFDVRWYGRNTTMYTNFGYSSLPLETNTLDVLTNVGFARNLAAGGQLLVDFANALTYEYTGGTHAVRSNIAVSLIQPLLRNAGRRVRLEALTQAERDTLYAVRDFARFRKAFWAGIAVGAGRPGGGYLDLLLAVQNLRNAQANLKRQEETYGLYYELFRGGRRSVVELDQFFQSLQQARLGVVTAELQLEAALDAFKLQLGLPPRIPVELDDSLLDQFVLTDPELEALRDGVEAFQRERLRELDEAPPADDLRGHFATLRGLADRVPDALGQAVADLERWGRQLDRPPRPADDPEARDRARAAYEDLRRQLPDIAADLEKTLSAIDRDRATVSAETRKEAWSALTQHTREVLSLLDAVIAVQTQSRIYLIELPEVDVNEADALAFAKENRLDLQNRLGLVTDAWRKVTVAANALRGDVNIIATANIVTEPGRNNPVAFTSDASRYTVGVQFDGPLNRFAERNIYRASLITYQRAKRDYVGLSDQIEFAIRQDLRGLTLQRAGFEIARQRLLSAARQFENERINLLRPRLQAGGSDATTLSLLQALASLLDARNALAASFISYEQQRVQLLLDLESLQLDQQGFPLHVPGTPAPAQDGRSVRPVERLPAPRPVPPAGDGSGGP